MSVDWLPPWSYPKRVQWAMTNPWLAGFHAGLLWAVGVREHRVGALVVGRSQVDEGKPSWRGLQEAGRSLISS